MMRCATDHEPCRQNLATLESSFGGSGDSGDSGDLAGGGAGVSKGDGSSNNNVDECAEALDMVHGARDDDDREKTKLTNLNEVVIHLESNQRRVTYRKERSPSSASNQGSYFDDF